jgi:hypothetical protein
MKMLTRLLKKNICDQNLASAATVIVGLENKLAGKEAEAEGLRISLEEFYRDTVLGEKNSKKISTIKVDLEELFAEIAGLKSVIDSAKNEALDLAQMEITESLAHKTKLQEQMKLETAEENRKILAALSELLISYYSLHGPKGAISRTPSFRINIPTDAIPDADINLANEKLATIFNKTTSGPHFTAEEIRRIEEQTARAEPNKLFEKALQDARSSSEQRASKKAA